LQTQFKYMYELISFYQKTLESLQHKFCLQETIIYRLQQFLSDNLGKEIEERLQHKYTESKINEASRG
jgi:hypothetical protein